MLKRLLPLLAASLICAPALAKKPAEKPASAAAGEPDSAAGAKRPAARLSKKTSDKSRRARRARRGKAFRALAAEEETESELDDLPPGYLDFQEEPEEPLYDDLPENFQEDPLYDDLPEDDPERPDSLPPKDLPEDFGGDSADRRGFREAERPLHELSEGGLEDSPEGFSEKSPGDSPGDSREKRLDKPPKEGLPPLENEDPFYELPPPQPGASPKDLPEGAFGPAPEEPLSAEEDFEDPLPPADKEPAVISRAMGRETARLEWRLGLGLLAEANRQPGLSPSLSLVFLRPVKIHRELVGENFWKSGKSLKWLAEAGLAAHFQKGDYNTGIPSGSFGFGEQGAAKEIIIEKKPGLRSLGPFLQAGFRYNFSPRFYFALSAGPAFFNMDSIVWTGGMSAGFEGRLLQISSGVQPFSHSSFLRTRWSLSVSAGTALKKWRASAAAQSAE